MSLTALTAILLAAAAQADSCQAKTAAECGDAKQAARACVVKCESNAACCDTPENCVCEISCEEAAECSQAKNASPTVLNFTAKWCGPCQKMSPVIDKLQQDGFAIKQIDIDEHPELARKFKVHSIPAFVATVNGREVARAVGATSKDTLISLFRRVEESPACSAEKKVVKTAPRPHHPGMHHVAMHLAPGASDVQMLVRATYELPPSKAKALMAFLEETASVEVETKLDGHRLTVTTSPEAQRSIGQFVSVMMPTRGHAETVAFKGEAKNTCKACGAAKRKVVHVKKEGEACSSKKAGKACAVSAKACKTSSKACKASACESKKACSGKKPACDKQIKAEDVEACRDDVEAVRIMIPMFGPVFAPPHRGEAPWMQPQFGGTMIGIPMPPAPGRRAEFSHPRFQVRLHPGAPAGPVDAETLARWRHRVAALRERLENQLGLDCDEVDCPPAPLPEEQTDRNN